MPGRREQLRAELEESILRAGRAELKRSGPSDLSLREVARGAGISPAGLYRYVDGRNGLLEVLIADGFQRFGRAVGSSIDGAGPAFLDRVVALALTYRQWATDHPEQFALILGTPVVGFRAQPGGVTDRAVRRFGLPMLSVFLDAHADGQLAGLALDGEVVHLSAFDSPTGDVPAALVDIAMRSWARIHGVVMLEACGHLDWTGRTVEDLLVAEAASIVTDFGAVPATTVAPDPR